MDIQDAYVTGKKEVKIKSGDKEYIFHVHELGYLQAQEIAIKAEKSGKIPVALLASESIADTDGNKFKYEEILRLKKEFAEPLFEEVINLHGLGELKN